jgi:hypothetical protein
VFGHLSRERIIDALEVPHGMSARERRHLEVCGKCGDRLAEAREGLDLVAVVLEDHFEPEEPYWDELRTSILRSAVAEAQEPVRLQSRPAFGLASSILAVGAVLGALAVAPSRPTLRGVEGETQGGEWSALPSIDEDGSLDLVRAAVEEMEWESAEDLGVLNPAVVAALDEVGEDEALAVALEAFNGTGWQGRI